nr:hypothetical protein [Tanacetum cinerariifolium]
MSLNSINVPLTDSYSLTFTSSAILIAVASLLLLAVGTFFTGCGNFFCQWELYNWQWECLMHFIPNSSQIKFEDINQIDEDDMEEMDIKWNMALLSMWADRFWKKTGKKITIQRTDVAGFDKSKVECFNFHKMCHFARECRAPRSHDRGRRDNYRQRCKVEEQTPKALMAINGVGWDWSFMANEQEDHALVADEEAPIEFALMAKTSAEVSKNMLFHYKAGLLQVEGRLAEFKNQEIKFCEKIRGLELQVEFKTNRIESLTNELELLKKEKGYSVVPPPPAQVYSPPKKDMSWTDLPEFVDDTITDYSRPSPTVENSLKVIKTNKKETVRKPSVKYTKLYRKPTKRSNVKGNQRNWNNLKSQQLGNNFVMKKACYNRCGIDHLSYECGKRVDHGSLWANNNNAHKSKAAKTVFHKTCRPPMRTNRPYMNAAQPKRTSFYKPVHSYNERPFQRTSAVRS